MKFIEHLCFSMFRKVLLSTAPLIAAAGQADQLGGGGMFDPLSEQLVLATQLLPHGFFFPFSNHIHCSISAHHKTLFYFFLLIVESRIAIYCE